MLYIDMMNFNFDIFPFCIWLFYMLDVVFSNKTRCFRLSSLGESIPRCCDNHVEQNGTCVECKPGFEALNSLSCKRCLPGNYGRKCGEVCHTCVKERCNHVIGCVYFIDRPISTDNQESIFTLPTELQRIHSTESKVNENSIFQGLHEREIIIYSISAGVVSFILLSCTFLLRRYKHRNANTRPFMNASSLEQIPNDDDIQVTGVSIEGGDGIYETIDDSSIPDILLSRAPRNQINGNSGSSSDDNSDPLPNDGYLNPYQPMAQECVKHGYSTIVDKSDSDCSSSNNGERGSGYLNPYQTIVPYQDKHDYYKVNDEQCLENKSESDFLKQSPNDTNTDAQSYDTPCKTTILCENENQCEKLDSSDNKDICEIDTKVRAPGCVEENEISHDEDQQACDIELKRCIGEDADSSDKK